MAQMETVKLVLGGKKSKRVVILLEVREMEVGSSVLSSGPNTSEEGEPLRPVYKAAPLSSI